MFKAIIRRRLEGYVKRYFARHPEVKLVVVTGSVGKTSTKMAIGTVLSEKLRVRLHEGNYNSELSAPVAMLGVAYPDNIKSLGAWRAVYKAMRQRIKEPTDVDVIVQELGTDRVGQIARFGKYIKPDIAVVTAVSAEHMEFFGTLDVVAREELSVVNYSASALINRDDIDGEYANLIKNPNINTYGTSGMAEYRFETADVAANDGFSGTFMAPEYEDGVEATLQLAGEHSIRAAVAAGAVGFKLGLSGDEIARGLAKIRAVPGRMNVLRGLKGATIIDDTYNSSPLAATSALRTLYQYAAPQRIAVFGSMNELGAETEAEHKALGELCTPSELAHVVIVGETAERFLAPAARANGCDVVCFRSPLEAGAFVNKVMEPGAVVLFKGSQGGIFLEEAVKIVLHSTDDIDQLVRQSPEWMAKKQAFFDSLS